MLAATLLIINAAALLASEIILTKWLSRVEKKIDDVIAYFTVVINAMRDAVKKH